MRSKTKYVTKEELAPVQNLVNALMDKLENLKSLVSKDQFIPGSFVYYNGAKWCVVGTAGKYITIRPTHMSTLWSSHDESISVLIDQVMEWQIVGSQ